MNHYKFTQLIIVYFLILLGIYSCALPPARQVSGQNTGNISDSGFYSEEISNLYSQVMKFNTWGLFFNRSDKGLEISFLGEWENIADQHLSIITSGYRKKLIHHLFDNEKRNIFIKHEELEDLKFMFIHIHSKDDCSNIVNENILSLKKKFRNRGNLNFGEPFSLIFKRIQNGEIHLLKKGDEEYNDVNVSGIIFYPDVHQDFSIYKKPFYNLIKPSKIKNILLILEGNILKNRPAISTGGIK